DRNSGIAHATTAKNSVWPRHSTQQKSTTRPPCEGSLPMNVQTLAIFVMVAIAIGGVAYVFIYPLLSGERKIEQRRASVTRVEPAAVRVSRTQQRSRREQVEETLKELEVKANKPKNLPLPMKIAQAGLSWSKTQFLMISGGLGLFAFVTLFIMSGSLLPAA